MWHPEQTWSVLHDDRRAALAAPRHTRVSTPSAPGGRPQGPGGPLHAVAPRRVEQPAKPSRPVLIAARIRRAAARLVTA